MLRRMRLIAASAACLMAAGPAVAVSPEDAADRESIPTLIERLDDSSYQTREEAASSLAAYGQKAIDPLVEAAQTRSLEVATRSVKLLEDLLQSGEATLVDAADEALLTLSESDRPHAAALAAAVLDRSTAIREERAIARITALGGQVQYAPAVDAIGRPLTPHAEGEDGEPAMSPRKILLGRDWKGGVEGLNHLRRLAHLRDLHLYVEKGSDVPLAEAQALAGVLPGLMVHHRGPYLGVAALSDGVSDCIIGDVMKDGPADKAGLRRRDKVLALNEQKIGQFHELVDSLKEYNIGDTVTVTVERMDPITHQQQRVDLEVELEPWQLAPVAEEAPDRMLFQQRMFIPPPQFPRQQPAPAPLPQR